MRSNCLIIFPGALGDFVCFLPALERLSRHARVELLARTEFSDLVSSSVTVGSLECHVIGQLFVRGAGERAGLRDFFAPYASVYSWFGSGVPVFAEELRRASQGKALLFPFRPLDGRMHQTDYYLSCLRLPPVATPTLAVKSAAMLWGDLWWREHGLAAKPVLALAPGSGALEKNWRADSYRVVADWWRQVCGGIVVVILGPVEEERAGFGSVCAGALVARGLTLGQLSALLSRSVVYLGNDSGTSHLAAALGIRTVVLFGPSDPLQWAPRGERVTIVRKGVECSPCTLTAMKSCSHRSCLTTLEPAEVIKRVKDLPEFTELDKVEGRDYSLTCDSCRIG